MDVQGLNRYATPSLLHGCHTEQQDGFRLNTEELPVFVACGISECSYIGNRALFFYRPY